MKRNKVLVPLSHEHHEGLLFVWKIRQGIRNSVPTHRIADFCQWFWNNHLEGHMAKEENILPQVLPVEHPMMQKMFDEHQAIKAQVMNLQEYACFQTLEHLAKVVECHIRFEERQLFKLIQELAKPGQLKELEDDNHKQAAEWADEFWLYKKSSTILPQSSN